MKLISTYRLIGCVLIACIYTGTLSAQSAKTSYFMQSVSAKNYLNPALKSDYSYFSIPTLGNIYTEIKTNTLKLEHLIFTENGKKVTFMHPSVDASKFLSNLSDANNLSAGISMDILSFGIRAKKCYVTIHLGMRAETEVNLPKSLFDLMKTGFEQEEEGYYDLSGITAAVKAYTELGVAYSRGFLNNNLNIGIRPKLLIGAGDMKLEVNKLDVKAGPEKWYVSPQATLTASAPGITPEYKIEDSGREKLDNFDFSWKGIPGMGFGLDLGFEYSLKHLTQYLDLPIVNNILSNISLSFAFNNIGTIQWSEKNNLIMQSPADELIITPDQYTIDGDGNISSLNDILEDISERVEEMIDLKEVPGAPGKRKTKLNNNMNIGIEYVILKNLTAGLLFSREMGEYNKISEFTLSVNYQPVKWFGMATSYSIDSKSENGLGFAFHLSPRIGPTLFVATDMIIPSISPQFIPVKTSRFNGQVGICFKLRGGKDRS